MKALGAAGGMQGLGATGPQALGADAGQRQGLSAAGLYGLGVDAGQHVLGTADSQHVPGDMAETPFGAASASGGSRRGNKKSRDDEVYFSSI